MIQAITITVIQAARVDWVIPVGGGCLLRVVLGVRASLTVPGFTACSDAGPGRCAVRSSVPVPLIRVRGLRGSVLVCRGCSAGRVYCGPVLRGRAGFLPVLGDRAGFCVAQGALFLENPHPARFFAFPAAVPLPVPRLLAGAGYGPCDYRTPFMDPSVHRFSRGRAGPPFREECRL